MAHKLAGTMLLLAAAALLLSSATAARANDALVWHTSMSEVRHW